VKLADQTAAMQCFSFAGKLMCWQFYHLSNICMSTESWAYHVITVDFEIIPAISIIFVFHQYNYLFTDCWPQCQHILKIYLAPGKILFWLSKQKTY